MLYTYAKKFEAIRNLIFFISGRLPTSHIIRQRRPLEALRATPAVAQKTRPLLLIWVLPYFLGFNIFASTPTVAPKLEPPNLFQRE